MWFYASLILLCGLIASTYLSVYYYDESVRYQSLYREAVERLNHLKTHMFINVLIDYGNGTEIWYNETEVPIGSSLLDVTRKVAKVDYQLFQYGAFVTAINGRGGDPGYYWMWYFWNSTSGKWEMGPVAADAYILHHGDTVSWVYEKASW
ncbi:DUF4430 domain-containing protein [Candidatus Bathyarchaeota archaeon]|nr:DUF4430 domain-containing protein [Candidatus Bathyarchaeota archaeon]